MTLENHINEKREQLRRERVAGQVERYCDGGLADEDDGLIESQAFDSKRLPRPRGES